MSNHIQFRSPTILSELKKRHIDLNSIAKRDLERYYTLLRYERTRINLSENEALFLCDVLNGCRNDFAIKPNDMLLAVAIGEDAAMTKWKLDKDNFIKKLSKLSLLQASAIIDAVEMFWCGDNYQIEDNLAKLKEVGLLN